MRARARTHTHTHTHTHSTTCTTNIREVVNLEVRISQIRDIPEQMIPHQLCYANPKPRLKFYKQHCEKQKPRLPQLLALFHTELKDVTPKNGTHHTKPSLTMGLKFPG
jgi:hypothetical protein